jgi:hypothetical protein
MSDPRPPEPAPIGEPPPVIPPQPNDDEEEEPEAASTTLADCRRRHPGTVCIAVWDKDGNVEAIYDCVHWCPLLGRLI